MKKLSTGQDSTLGEYRKLCALLFPHALPFLDEKIMNSSKGEDEEVFADEGQMIFVLQSIGKEERRKENE